MGAVKRLQPNSGTPPKPVSDIENTVSLGADTDPESTLATVMMTRLYDTAVEVKFNRLMLMAQNDKVAGTYPLNRKITTIGRSRRNHIRIKDPLVSVRHLTVHVSGNTCAVNDLESSNGTFINGERVVGSHVLKDGEEIILGKTLLRFAARQISAPVSEAKTRQRPAAPSRKNRLAMLTAALLFLFMCVALVYLGTHIASRLYTDQNPTVAQNAPASPRPVAVENKEGSQPLVRDEKKTDQPADEAPAKQVSLIRRALADYAAGRIDSTERTLKMLSAAKAGTPVALQAQRMLSTVGTVKDLHVRALRAQEEKMFARALDYWDRLLILDMELVGDRPSFFASRAEQTVQELAYEHALEAYRLKNHQKVRQLCNIILQINPNHAEALALLAKINPKV